DAVAHRPELMAVRAREAVTQSHVARGRHAQQSKACATWPRFARTTMNLTERLANVAESVMVAGNRRVSKVVGQIAKLREHAFESRVTEGVRPARGRGDRRKADFVEADVVRQVIVNAS